LDGLLGVIRGYFGLKKVFLKDTLRDLCEGKTERIWLVNMNEEGTLFLNLGRKMGAKVANESLEENHVTWKHDIFSYSSFYEI